MDEFDIRREDLTSPDARALIQRLNAELTEQYPEPGANHFRLDAEEVGEEQGAFLVARLQGQPVACGAVRRFDDHTAEVKRMFVDPAARGRGLGRQVLAALEDEARRVGCTRLVLETGTRQIAAMHLYQQAGFVKIPLFGEYVSTPDTSVCMGKEL